MYQNNTRIVTLSSDMKNHLLGKNIDSKKISIIGNWVDTDEIRYIPRSDNPLFDRFGLNKKQFYVTYSGNLGHAQDIHSILEAAGILQKEVPEIQFLIIGSGVLEEKFKRQALFEKPAKT
jgi:Glycosyltransferase